MRARASTRNDPWREALGAQALDDTHERLEQLTGARAPEVVGDGVLMVADVALDSRVLEVGGVGDLLRKRHDAILVNEAGAAPADLDVHQDLERAPRAFRGHIQLGDVGRVVGYDDQAFGPRVEGCEALQLRLCDDGREEHDAR